MKNTLGSEVDSGMQIKELASGAAFMKSTEALAGGWRELWFIVDFPLGERGEGRTKD